MDPLLKQLLEVPTSSGHCDLMQEFILSIYPNGKIDKEGNIYLKKGKGPYPCIVAHMDTVHDHRDKIVAMELNGNIYGMNPVTCAQTGIGGDDKCGIWCALVMFHSLKNCKVALFVDEEIGCQGSRRADLDFFKDCRYILQADRRNDNGDDFVHYISGPLMSEEFKAAVKPYVEKHGFSFSYGAMTDVMQLRNDNVGVSCANMSAGYYRPHSHSEVINIGKLNKAVNIMYDICLHVKEVFPFIEEKPVYPSYHTSAPYSGPYYGSRGAKGAEHQGYHHRWYKNDANKTVEEKIAEAKPESETSVQDAVVVDHNDEVQQSYLEWWEKTHTEREERSKRIAQMTDEEFDAHLAAIQADKNSPH